MHLPRLRSVATSLPHNRMTQAEVKQGVAEVFAGHPELERLLPLFDRAGIETRYFAFPKDYYLDAKPFGRRNDDYIALASRLGVEAVGRALESSGLGPKDGD